MNDAEAVDFLRRLLEIESHTNDEAAAVALVVETMRAHGLSAGPDDVGNAVGKTDSGSGPQLMFLGHVDTAPGTVAIHFEGDRLYGRGAVDAKGPLAAAVVACSRSGNVSALTIVGAVGEEGSSHGARHLLNTDPPDAVIIGEPGGSDSIVLGYKGSMRATLSFSQPSAHTAGPADTIGDVAVDAWMRVRKVCASFSTGGGTFHKLTPALLVMTSQTDGMDQTASMRASFRLPPDAPLDEIRAQISEAVQPGTVAFELADPAYLGRKDNRLVTGLMRAIRDEGVKPHFKVKTGTSDMNVVAPVWRCPTVAYGPGDSSLDHTPDEHIVIDEYLRGIRVLTRVFEEWA